MVTQVQDTDVHQDSSKLALDIEKEYDTLFHKIEAETGHGVEHHDVTYKTLPLHRKEYAIAHDYHTSDFYDDHQVHPAVAV